MARYANSNNQLAMQWESGTYATSSGGGLWIGLVTDHSLDENTNVTPLRYHGTTTRNVDLFVDGAKDFTGTFTYHPQDWRMLVAVLGSNVDAGSPSPYTHSIGELDNNARSVQVSGTLNPFTSFTLEDSKTVVGTGLNFIRTAVGCNVNTWSLNGAQGEILSADVDYVAQNVTFASGAKTSITEDTTRPFLWRDVTLHIPSGTKIQELKSFTLTVNNNLESPHYLNGSEVIAPSVPLNRDYEFTATLDAVDSNSKTFWTSYFQGGSTFNMMLEVNASTGSRDAFFIFSGCKMMDMEMPSPTEGVTESSLTIQPRNCVVKINDLTFRYNPW